MWTLYAHLRIRRQVGNEHSVPAHGASIHCLPTSRAPCKHPVSPSSPPAASSGACGVFPRRIRFVHRRHTGTPCSSSWPVCDLLFEYLEKKRQRSRYLAVVGERTIISKSVDKYKNQVSHHFLQYKSHHYSTKALVWQGGRDIIIRRATRG